MRKCYTLLFYALLPLVLLRLYWRGRQAPQYRRRWRERLGIYQNKPIRQVIWLHAVSVGEVEAAVPLIKHLQQRYPATDFLVTTTTPTGSARVQAVLADSVTHVYLPYDVPCSLDRFFKHFQPKMAVFMEKEIWPNLYAACQDRQIPLFIVNARLSARSARAYQKIPGLVKPALAQALIAAQTRADSENFAAIGVKPEQICVLGNIKFDVSIAPELIQAGRELKQTGFAGRFVWIIGSSHHGEEAIILPLYPLLKQQIPELLLVIAPRHPERFPIVQKLCEAESLNVLMRSRQQPVTAACDVYIADSIGELKMLYAAADVAFVGGSLVPVGGHNVLEPAAVGVPVLFGPQMFNFQEIAAQMLAAGAAWQCADGQDISATVLRVYQDQDFGQQLSRNAERFLRQNQGATQAIADWLAAYL